MKKKHTDSQQASELLKKLQAAVLASSKRKEPKQDEPDRDELEFQKKLEGMLSRATAAINTSAPKKKSEKKPKHTAPEEPVEEKPTDTVAEISDEPIEEAPKEAEAATEIKAEPLPEEAPPEKPAKKQDRKKKKKERQVSAAATETIKPTKEAEPTVEDEPIVEDESTVTEPIASANEPETVCEETTVADSDNPDQTDESTEAEKVLVANAYTEEPSQKPETVSLRLSVRQAPPIASTPTPTPKPTITPSEPHPQKQSVAHAEIGERKPPVKATAPASPAMQPIVIKPPRKEPAAEAPKSTQPLQPRKPSGPIVITPPDYRKEDMKKKTQKPQAGVSLPRGSGQTPIVITPPPSKTPSRPIVIKPRGPERASEPTRKETPMPTEKPIAVSPKAKEVPSAATADQPKAATAGTHEKKPARNPSAGVSLPRASAPQKSKPKKRPARVGHTPIAPLPEDEDLDEALDTIVTEEAITEILPVDEPEPVSAPKKQSIFDRRRERRVREAEETATAISLIEAKTGLTEDDIAMIFELGYENDLGRLVGYETLKRLKYDYIRKSKRADASHFRTAFGYRNEEYTGAQPAEKILSCYAKDRVRLILRTVFTVLIALFLIPAEFPGLLGALLAPYTTAYPLLLPVASLLLLTVSSILSIRELDAGLRSLFRFTPTPYSVNAILVPIALLYGVLSLFLPDLRAVSATLPAAWALVVGAVGDAIRLSCEMQTFRMVSSDGEKTVLDAAEPHKKKLRQGDKIVKIINDDVGQNLYRVRRAERMLGFFRRCNDFSAFAKPFHILNITAFSLALLSGLIAAVWTSSATAALSTAMLTLLCSFPIPAVLLCFSSLQIANRSLARRGCALVGEESVEEYAEPQTVIFNDSDMYHAQKCTQISVREGEDFRGDMRIAGILFRKMSGTLAGVAPLKNPQDPPVAFVRLAENGTEAVVDNHHVLAGNAEFLARSGVRVPRESTDRTLRRAKNVSLMYVAIDGTLKLSYEIEYTVSARFEALVELLADHDTETAIQTYDPNINETFLNAVRPEGADYVRVIKPGRYESDTPTEVTDSGALSLGDRFDAVLPTVAATEIKSVRRIGFRILLLLSVLFAIPALLLGVKQALILPGILTALPLLLQSVTLVGMLIATHISIRRRLE